MTCRNAYCRLPPPERIYRTRFPSFPFLHPRTWSRPRFVRPRPNLIRIKRGSYRLQWITARRPDSLSDLCFSWISFHVKKYSFYVFVVWSNKMVNKILDHTLRNWIFGSVTKERNANWTMTHTDLTYSFVTIDIRARFKNAAVLPWLVSLLDSFALFVLLSLAGNL